MARTILIKRSYPQSIERVWRALTDPDELSRWLMPNDLRIEVGHKFTFRAPKKPGFNGIIECEVLEVEAPYLIAYSWKGGPMKRPTIVTWRLQSRSDGGTDLVLEHSGFAEDFASRFVRFLLSNGWKSLLGRALPKSLGS
jgi:uncharacterized protein YndB with AHSA1/START domain